MCADQCFLQQKSSRYDTSASIAAQADGTSRSSMLTQMATADVKGAIHITDRQATPATAWVLLSSYLNSRCTSRNHAASACVLAGIGNVLSPHHTHEQDVASYSAYMQNCECSQQRAVQQVIKLQRRLTGSSIMSYSLDMTCVAQQSTFMLRHSDAVRRPSGKNCTLTVSTTGRQQSAVSQQLSLNKTAPSQNTKGLRSKGINAHKVPVVDSGFDAGFE